MGAYNGDYEHIAIASKEKDYGSFYEIGGQRRLGDQTTEAEVKLRIQSIE